MASKGERTPYQLWRETQNKEQEKEKEKQLKQLAKSINAKYKDSSDIRRSKTMLQLMYILLRFSDTISFLLSVPKSRSCENKKRYRIEVITTENNTLFSTNFDYEVEMRENNEIGIQWNESTGLPRIKELKTMNVNDKKNSHHQCEIRCLHLLYDLICLLVGTNTVNGDTYDKLIPKGYKTKSSNDILSSFTLRYIPSFDSAGIIQTIEYQHCLENEIDAIQQTLDNYVEMHNTEYFLIGKNWKQDQYQQLGSKMKSKDQIFHISKDDFLLSITNKLLLKQQNQFPKNQKEEYNHYFTQMR